MYAFAKKLLFKLDPEQAHELSMDWLGAAHRLKLLPPYAMPQGNPVKLMGLEFANRVGLAAGLDKNADYLDALGALGFGFVEVGTVTPLAQPGNPEPRLFRLNEQRGIINRMGFNNKGVAKLVDNLKRRKYRGVVGVNIGKNKLTSQESALQDYLYCMDAVYAYADYIALNISSPNTPGLRALQLGSDFRQLLQGVKQRQLKLADSQERYVPIAVKIAPDLSREQLNIAASEMLDCKLDAVIATNTTVSRVGIDEQAAHREQVGGVSGGPLRQRSTDIVAALAEQIQGEIPIIGVGGIMDPQDAVEKRKAGASLVQLYSGLVFEGPRLIPACVRALNEIE